MVLDNENSTVGITESPEIFSIMLQNGDPLKPTTSA